ncbi:MAG: hypothetical protein AAF434_17365 [Pseudomonadota bacterium]
MSSYTSEAQSFVNLRFPDASSDERLIAATELAQILQLHCEKAFQAGQRASADSVANFFREMAMQINGGVDE